MKNFVRVYIILLISCTCAFGQVKEVNIVLNKDETTTVKFGSEIKEKKWMTCQSGETFVVDMSEKEIEITYKENAGPCTLRMTLEKGEKLDLIITAADVKASSEIDLSSESKIDKWIKQHPAYATTSVAETKNKETQALPSGKVSNENDQPEKSQSQVQSEKLGIKTEQLTRRVKLLLDNFAGYCQNIGNHKIGNFEVTKKQVLEEIFANDKEAIIQTINKDKVVKSRKIEDYLMYLYAQTKYKQVDFKVKMIQILSDVVLDANGYYSCVISYQQVFEGRGGSKEDGVFTYRDVTSKKATLKIDVKTMTDPATGEIYQAFIAYIQDISADSINQ